VGSDFEHSLHLIVWAASPTPSIRSFLTHARLVTPCVEYLFIKESARVASDAMHQRPGGSPIALVLYVVAIVGESDILFIYLFIFLRTLELFASIPFSSCSIERKNAFF